MNPLTQFYYSLLSFFGCVPNTNSVDATPISNFDLNRYLGKWYEIARFDHSFERGLDNVTATYSVRCNGEVLVENAGIKNGRHRHIVGRAKLTNKSDSVTTQSGMLKVAFFANFFSPYTVIMLDEDYSYALVTSGRRYLWILSRTPQIPHETIEEIYREAARRRFDLRRFILVNQDI